MLEQQVQALEAKIAEQQAQLKELSSRTDQANQQLQSIANRALDTSVKRYSFSNDDHKMAS